jgi:hypothetical protein
MKTKLTIELTQEGERRFPTSPAYPLAEDETPYGETISFTYGDISDFNIHQLFAAFEKVVMSLGYAEKTIMKGACQLAFNSARKASDMSEVAREYDLEGEF